MIQVLTNWENTFDFAVFVYSSFPSLEDSNWFVDVRARVSIVKTEWKNTLKMLKGEIDDCPSGLLERNSVNLVSTAVPQGIALKSVI